MEDKIGETTANFYTLISLSTAEISKARNSFLVSFTVKLWQKLTHIQININPRNHCSFLWIAMKR